MLSGVFEGGYSIGYLLAAAFYRALVPTTPYGWRSLFWFGAGPPILIIAFRWVLPETNYFQVMKAEREARVREQEATGTGRINAQGLRSFLKDSRKALRDNWFLFAYLVVLMTGFNSCSHGSQDFYPTFLKDQVGISETGTTIITIIGQVAGFVGSAIGGYISSFFGRRLTMLCFCIVGGAVVPAYTLPRDMSLIAGAFFEQFFAGAVWGPIPIHLLELAPFALRTSMMGLTYQLGNLASSACATIQSVIGERYPLPPIDGVSRFDYGRVIGIFLGAVWAYMFFFLFWGPEISQEERDEEAAAAMHFESLRLEGVDLATTTVEKTVVKKADEEKVDVV